MARPERFELPTSWFVATHSKTHFSLLIQGLFYYVPPNQFLISKSFPLITVGFSRFIGRTMERLYKVYPFGSEYLALTKFMSQIKLDLTSIGKIDLTRRTPLEILANRMCFPDSID